MGIITINCPWPDCGRHFVAARVINVRDGDEPVWYARLLLSCGGCKEWVLAHVVTKNVARASDFYEIDGEVDHLVDDITLYPQPKPLAAPEHTHPLVSRMFNQALDNVGRRNWDAAGGMARKSLETAIKVLNPDAAARAKLHNQIDRLAELQLIPPLLKDWAHEIRKGGNDALHEDEYSEEEARQLCDFTEMFLEYVFTMPAKLKKRRQAKAKE